MSPAKSGCLALMLFAAPPAIGFQPAPTLDEPVPAPLTGLPSNGTLWFAGTAIVDGWETEVIVNGGAPQTVEVTLHGDSGWSSVELAVPGLVEGDHIELGGDGYWRGEPGEWMVVGQDAEAPSLAEVPFTLFAEGLTEGCSNPLAGVPCGFGVAVDITAASDNFGVGHYRVSSENGSVADAIVHGNAEDGRFGSSPTRGVTLILPGAESRTECFMVTAVDVARNEVTSASDCIDLEGGGCSAPGSSTTVPVHLLGVVLGFIALRRRTREGREFLPSAGAMRRRLDARLTLDS